MNTFKVKLKLGTNAWENEIAFAKFALILFSLFNQDILIKKHLCADNMFSLYINFMI